MNRGLLLVVVLVSWGEASSALPANSQLEEIIVTAQRRDQNLQRIPVAVTALTQDALTVRQITDVHALQFAVPSLAIYPILGNPMAATVSLRELCAMARKAPSAGRRQPTAA